MTDTTTIRLTPNMIRERREALGMTQKTLAELVGCTETSVANWEAGRKDPLAVYRAGLKAALFEVDAGGYPVNRLEEASEYREDRLRVTFRLIPGSAPARLAVDLAGIYAGFDLEAVDTDQGPAWRVVQLPALGEFTVRGKAVADAVWELLTAGARDLRTAPG